MNCFSFYLEHSKSILSSAICSNKTTVMETDVLGFNTIKSNDAIIAGIWMNTIHAIIDITTTYCLTMFIFRQIAVGQCAFVDVRL